jgi:hypothetical protein
MDRKKLRKIKQKLEEMKRSPQGRSSRDFEAIANDLGRYKDDRGAEPTYTRKSDPSLSPPLSIPHHSKDMKVRTARSIINALLNDVDDWELFLRREDDDENDDK